MDVFGLHQHVISEYATYTKSFIKIANARIAEEVDRQIKDGLLWPYPLIQLNPSFEPGSSIDNLCQEGVLHQECARILGKDIATDLALIKVATAGLTPANFSDNAPLGEWLTAPTDDPSHPPSV